MAKLTGKGTPTRKTVGAIGDIYIDTTTGKRYKCIFAYRSNNDSEFDCQWLEEKSVVTDESKEEAPEQKEESKEEEPEEKEQKEEEKPETPQRTDYTAYGKKNN